MAGIIHDLQNNLISDQCDILSSLRKAKVIAAKLNLVEFETWIDQELNGYQGNTAPEYRKVRGLMRAYYCNNWLPVQMSEKLEKICEQYITQSISTILEYAKSTDHLRLYPGAKLQNALNDLYDLPLGAEFALIVESGAMKAIVEAVKNALLNWTLELEKKGIVGENLTFSREEKEVAKELSTSVSNFYGQTNIISAPIENAQLTSGNNNQASMDIDVHIGKELLSELKTTINEEAISDESKSKALQLLEEISQKIDQKRKPKVIKSIVTELKEFLVGVGANVAAAFIQSRLHC